MTRGVRRLSKLQFSREGTYGTPTAGTLVWRGKASFLEDGREVTEVEEDVGYIGMTDRSYIAKDIGMLSVEETEATYEQLQYLFVGAGWGNAAGSAQGAAGSTYVFTNAVPTTSGLAAGTPYTFYSGDDAEAEQGTSFYCRKISIKGEGGGALMVSSEWAGKGVNRAGGGTFPTPAALETVEEVIFGQGTLFLNGVGTNYGATQVSNQLLSLDMDIELKWKEKYTEGGTTPAYFVYTTHNISGNLTFEHDSTGSIIGNTSQKNTNWRGGTAQLMRLQWTGSTISSGTTHTVQTFRIDLPVKWKKFEPLDEDDGNNTITGQFFSRYNITAGNAGTFLIARDGALP